jgi:hypothetical protein
MRTVICYLTGCTQEEVARVLDARFVAQTGDAPWLLVSESRDPVLYIDFYKDIDTEHEADEVRAIRAALGGEIQVSVAANVSGRHNGAVEATTFALTLLSRFCGLASDDFGDQLWTRNEIEQRAIVDGRRFFEPLQR